MNEVIETNNIRDKIYEINGVQIMIDSDLAKLYNVETKRINEAVSRNSNKFPERFSWILSELEWESLRSQNATSSYKNNYGGRRYMPRVFTEHGVYMLATILKSKEAVDVSIRIMDTFVAMKKYISSNLLEQKFINEMVIKDNKRLDLIEETLEGFKEKNNHIFFDGQIYDAYSVMLDIINKSKKSIVIIDNYLDKNLLDILCKTDKEILVITSSYNKNDFNNYMEEYDNVTIKLMDNIHDRFIIIDNNLFYNFGASFKDLGKKCFSINKIEDKASLNKLINYIT